MFFREIKQPQMVPELNENICFLFWPNGSRTDFALTLCCSVLAENYVFIDTVWSSTEKVHTNYQHILDQ